MSSSQAAVHITTGGRERVQQATELLSKAFEADPTINYLLSSLSAEHRAAYRPKFFQVVLTSAALNQASFDEINGWKSCGVLMPPGTNAERYTTALSAGFLQVLWTVGLAGCQRMLREFPGPKEVCKAKVLRKGEKYYYVYFLGTREDGRGKGLCSAMVRHYQSIAADAHLPIYMEAGTEYCWGLYKTLGFVTVDEMVFGKGKSAADGTPCAGGPGIKIWGMIWRPEQSAA